MVVRAAEGLDPAYEPLSWARAASLRGHAWTSGTTGDTLTISPNTSGQTRIDRVVLRLDRNDWTVRAVVKLGTPGAGPPVLTTGEGYNTFEALLANVTVQNGASSVTVTRGERYVGSRMRPCTSTSLTNPNPQPGDLLWEVDTNRIRFYDGQALRTIYSESGVKVVNSPISSWSVPADSVLEEKNGSVHLRLGAFTRTGGTVSSEVRLPVLVPAAYRHPTRGQYGIAYITGGVIGRLEVYADNTSRAGQVWLTQYAGSIVRGDFVMPGSGISWVVD